MKKIRNDELELELELLPDVIESQQASALEYGMVPLFGQHTKESVHLFNVCRNKFVFLKFLINF